MHFFAPAFIAYLKKIEPFTAGSPVVSLNVQIGFMTR
jgi:hypothetical protein